MAVASNGWRPGETILLIAGKTGLTEEQVRDAIFGESADEWRRDLTRRLAGEDNASS